MTDDEYIIPEGNSETENESKTEPETTSEAEAETSGGSSAPVYQITVTEDPRPFLTTDFEDYTVSEGLLLFLLLFAFITALWRFVRRTFSWLLW